MAPVVMAVTAIASAAMSYQGYKQQKEAASTAEKMGRMNAAAIEAETQEEAYRLKENQKRALAEATALGSATGFAGGTQDIYLSDISKTQRRELNWLMKSGKSRSEIAKMSGIQSAQVAEAQAMGSLASTVGSVGEAVASGYQYGQSKQWWS